jgi:hypothetical protein
MTQRLEKMSQEKEDTQKPYATLLIVKEGCFCSAGIRFDIQIDPSHNGAQGFDA